MFRLNEVFNLRNKDEQKRDFDLLSDSFKKEKVAKMKFLKCVLLDRFTFLDYI